MSMITPMILLACFLYLLIPTGLLCILQYVLAKLESPWPGRVLPILSVVSSLCISLIILLNMVGGSPALLFIPLAALLILNLPTAAFLIVYRVTRRKHVEKKGMDKMNIQDLE